MPRYSRFNPRSYYEAKLQIRPRDTKVYARVVEKIKKEHIKIARQNEFKYGYDIFFVSRKTCVAFARDLKKIFSGKIKITKTIYSRDRQTGREVYRITVLFKISLDSSYTNKK